MCARDQAGEYEHPSFYYRSWSPARYLLNPFGPQDTPSVSVRQVAARKDPGSQALWMILTLTVSLEDGASCSVGAWEPPGSRRLPRKQGPPYCTLRRVASLNFTDCLLSNISPEVAEWYRLFVSGCYGKGKVCVRQVIPETLPPCLARLESKTFPTCGRRTQAFTHSH